MSFKQFLINEVDPMGGMGMPPPGMPPMGAGGMGGPPPMGGPMGAPPPGGGLGMPPGGDPMGGMGGPPMGGAGIQPQVPLKMQVSDVWTTLEKLLKDKDGDQSISRQPNLVKQDSKHLLK